jgi:hypothetical protein
MKVRAKETGFYKGHRQREGSVFEFTGEKLGKWMVPLDNADVTDTKDETGKDATGPTTKEIKVLLEKAGISYNARASKSELQELLADVTKQSAPASSGAPDKSLIIN